MNVCMNTSAEQTEQCEEATLLHNITVVLNEVTDIFSFTLLCNLDMRLSLLLYGNMQGP